MVDVNVNYTAISNLTALVQRGGTQATRLVAEHPHVRTYALLDVSFDEELAHACRQCQSCNPCMFCQSRKPCLHGNSTLSRQTAHPALTSPGMLSLSAAMSLSAMPVHKQQKIIAEMGVDQGAKNQMPREMQMDSTNDQAELHDSSCSWKQDGDR